MDGGERRAPPVVDLILCKGNAGFNNRSHAVQGSDIEEMQGIVKKWMEHGPSQFIVRLQKVY